jgi:hypothetical protein
MGSSKSLIFLWIRKNIIIKRKPKEQYTQQVFPAITAAAAASRGSQHKEK